MPAKSKAQLRWLHAAEARGEVPKGTAKRWAEHTPDIKNLPERVKKAASLLGGINLPIAPLKVPPVVNKPGGSPLGPGPAPAGIPGRAALFPGPLTDAKHGLYGLRKSVIAGQAAPVTTSNLGGRVKPG